MKTGRAERALDVLDREPIEASPLAFAVLRKRALEELGRPVPADVANRAAEIRAKPSSSSCSARTCSRAVTPAIRPLSSVPTNT